MQTLTIRPTSIREALNASIGADLVAGITTIARGYIVSTRRSAAAYRVARQIIAELGDPDAPDARVTVEPYVSRDETETDWRIVVEFVGEVAS